MNPWRKAELKAKAEGITQLHHGGSEIGAALLECLFEIDELEFKLTIANQRIVDYETCLCRKGTEGL